jgi:hypothetical protein
MKHDKRLVCEHDGMKYRILFTKHLDTKRFYEKNSQMKDRVPEGFEMVHVALGLKSIVPKLHDKRELKFVLKFNIDNGCGYVHVIIKKEYHLKDDIMSFVVVSVLAHNSNKSCFNRIPIENRYYTENTLTQIKKDAKKIENTQFFKTERHDRHENTPYTHNNNTPIVGHNVKRKSTGSIKIVRKGKDNV